MSQKYQSTLQDKKEIAKDTMVFYFTKPAGFSYQAGQSVDITLIDPLYNDALGNTRTFSLASSPFEDHLMIGVRMRDSAFKQTLKEMAIGHPILIEGPWRSFTLAEQAEKPVVMMTGGIGVTPLLSMIRQANHQQLPHRILFFYANKTQEHAPFMGDLENLAEANLNFTFIPTMTQDESWTGIKGRINTALLSQYIRDVTKPIYYICGSIDMTNSLRDMLMEIGVPEDNIVFEDFPGY